MNIIDQKIASAIVAAQDGSDYAKGNACLPLTKRKTRHTRNIRCGGYNCKVYYINLAIRLIRKNRTQFNYWVEEGKDQNKYPSIIVYFEYDGLDIQISFHTPLSKAGELRRFVSTGRHTRWNKKLGKSREDCVRLIEYFGIQ